MEYRKLLLEIIEEHAKRPGPESLQSGSVLKEAKKQLGLRAGLEKQQALLAAWYDLFRHGYLSWGHDLRMAEPPHFHLTEHGERTLEHLSRDPSNPDGYLANLSAMDSLNEIAHSYVVEALRTYNTACYKAAAVMVGAATESVVLELRDTLVRKEKEVGQQPHRQLRDFRIKVVIERMEKEFSARKGTMPHDLKGNFQAYWPAYLQHIRAARNEAGHPSSIEPVTAELVHASLLIFPMLVQLAEDLGKWLEEQ